ncbi:MAG: VWA domain-containing protein [Nanoarchaeota archaeon]
MTFVRPIYLVLLLSVPFLVITHFFTYIHVRKRAMRFANFDAIRRVTGGDRKISANTVFVSRNVFVLIMRVSILILLIFSAAGPILWFTGQSTESSFMIAIDTSSSMLADDLIPNRLAAAKEAASSFIDQLRGHTHVGLMSFSGATFIHQALTEDKAKVRTALLSIEPSRVGGTDLGGAIVTAINEMSGVETSKSVVVMTDGRGNVGTDIEEAVDYAKEQQATLFTIGVGTPEGGSFLRTLAVSKLDEESLKAAAEATGGKYHSATNQEELDIAFTEIAAAREDRIPLHLSMGLMLIALVIIFIEWGLINTKYRTVP